MIINDVLIMNWQPPGDEWWESVSNRPDESLIEARMDLSLTYREYLDLIKQSHPIIRTTGASPAQQRVMKMSTAMQLVGYGALPGGEELIRKEQEREKSKQPQYPDFPFSIQRDFSDDEIELAIQVTHYRPPGNNGSLDHRDPAYDAGAVSFGDAVVVSTGNTIELTPLEWDAVEEAFWNQ